MTKIERQQLIKEIIASESRAMSDAAIADEIFARSGILYCSSTVEQDRKALSIPNSHKRGDIDIAIVKDIIANEPVDHALTDDELRHSYLLRTGKNYCRAAFYYARKENGIGSIIRYGEGRQFARRRK